MMESMTMARHARADGAGMRSSERERLLPYLALEVPKTTALAAALLATAPASKSADEPVGGAVVALAERLQALTPRLMRWSDEIWLLDISACESYWLAQAAIQGTSVVSLVRNIVQSVTGAAGTVRAAMASHPWQALLLVQHMRERRLTGLVTGNGPFGASLFREVSWDLWWTCAETLVGHLEATDRRRANRVLFRRQSEQMRRAVKRLGLATPWQMRDVSALAIKRRFGALMRDLWDWAYGAPLPVSATAPASEGGGGGRAASVQRALFADVDGLGPFAADFPWRGFVWAHRPQIQRHLDYALCEWSHLEPLLREDFDRLCALPSWQAGERVVSLEWRLVFNDLSHLTIPIRFRHPHVLHLEKGVHATALLQALYSFESSMPRQSRTYEGAQSRDTSMPVIPVISWDLAIAERMTLPARSLGLFGDQIALATGAAGPDTLRCSQEEMSLLQLENKLPIRLEAYDLKHDWLPEDSFVACGGPGASASASLGDGSGCSPEALRSLTAAAQRRPLFLYRKPTLFDSQGCSSVWQFCERTMAKWWLRSAQPSAANAAPAHAGGLPEATLLRTTAPPVAIGRDLQRDYYRVTDKEQRSFWVFRDMMGQWQVHGVFA